MMAERRRQLEGMRSETCNLKLNNNPSFSSALLESIYRSTDEGDGDIYLYGEPLRTRGNGTVHLEKWTTCERKTAEKWMMSSTKLEKKKTTGEAGLRRKSPECRYFEAVSCPQDQRKTTTAENLKTKEIRIPNLHFTTMSSSSESSGFSSSETDSALCRSAEKMKSKKKVSVRKKIPSPITVKKQPLNQYSHFPVPVRTSTETAIAASGESKKAKQPISPGTRIANFVQSLIASASPRKAKLTSQLKDINTGEDRIVASTCSTSSASTPSSRSCLTKTSSSAATKLPNSTGDKRSVRFYPMSVIVGEDSRPIGQKFLYIPADKDSSTSMNPATDRSTTRDLITEYKKKLINARDDEEDEDDSDAASCSSSDLFELENLAGIGLEAYGKELPVYGTTSFQNCVKREGAR